MYVTRYMPHPTPLCTTHCRTPHTMSCAAYQRIMSWLEGAPGGDAKRLGERLKSGSNLSKSEMETLCCLMQVINEQVVLVKLTLHKGKVTADCQDPHDVLEEWGYPDVEGIMEETFENLEEPACLSTKFYTSGLKGLVARGVMKEHFHPKGMEYLHDPNPPDACMFTITHMYDVAVFAQIEAQDSASSKKRKAPTAEPTPSKKHAH